MVNLSFPLPAAAADRITAAGATIAKYGDVEAVVTEQAILGHEMKDSHPYINTNYKDLIIIARASLSY